MRGWPFAAGEQKIFGSYCSSHCSLNILSKEVDVRKFLKLTCCFARVYVVCRVFFIRFKGPS